MNEDAKAYLNKYLDAKKEVRIIEETLAETIATLNEGIDCISVDYSGMPRSGIITSKTENKAIDLADATSKLRKAKEEAVALMTSIVNDILSVGSAEISKILFSRYIKGHSWKYIEMETYSSESKVMRLHRQGLQLIGEMRRARNEETNDTEGTSHLRM